MSAKRIILKRSSIAGKRPTSENLSPGELGLNTNSLEPGIFFEVTDGQIVKAGPPAVLPYSPTSFPEKGELWYDLEDGTLNVGDAQKHWRTVAAPFLGGGGSVVFVAPEFEYSTDSLRNDGQALPFQTLSRAILELSKIYISRVLTGFSTSDESNRYTIFLSSSVITANNGPGVSVTDFTVNFSSSTETAVTTPQLQQFNPIGGGIIVPFGISIRGLDLKKCIISPSYVPTYLNPSFPPASQGVDQPLSSILKCGGNVLANDFSVIDKLTSRVVISVSDKNSLAVFGSERPHGLGFNDLVSVSFEPTVDQSTGTFTAGNYYAIPLDTYNFYLSYGSQTESSAAEYVPFAALPLLSSGKTPKLSVTNTLKSSHRLKIFENATLADIGDYFTKVQRAFPDFFGGRVTEGSKIVNSGDYVIVGPVGTYPNNEGSNTTKNSSFYANQVNLRSEYGMNWGDFDGSIVSGFKSVIANACTAISLQNDPCVYEIYTTLVNPATGLPEQKWWNLSEAKFLSTPVELRPPSIADVPVSEQLSLLNSTPINNIRYYYKNLTEPGGASIGIVDIEKDFRHFGFRVRNGAYGQFQSVYSIGPAIGVWALNGGLCSLTNSTTNFGSVAFKSEGFLGINTIGGAKPNGKGFVLEGVQRPLALLKSQVESQDNKKILSLGGKISSIYIDPEDPNIQILGLNSDFLPCYLLPYSLAPGTALWVETESCTYRGFLATDGGPTIITGLGDPINFAKIRLRSSDSTIPNDESLLPVLGVPYIRRFIDPRLDFERSYSLYIRNTLPNAIAPQVGSVLRLNQTSQQLGSVSLRPNVQFDPGILGGWGRIFTVDATETGGQGSSPQFNYVIGDSNQDLTYYVAITTTDYSRPWGQGPNFDLPAGSYTTYRNRNWYSAENNLWNCVYYGDASSFTDSFGPYSVAPVESCSPFVDTSVLERQDKVSETFQGSYAADSYLALVGYLEQTYFRGATEPYPTYSSQNVYDGDDSTEGLGLCLKDLADGEVTYTVSELVEIQSEQQATLTPTPQRYRPAIVEFSVLSSVNIENPRQTASVLRLSSVSGVEYIRVINLNGTVVRGIRLTYENSYYPTTLPGNDWPQQTTVTVCSTNPIPQSELYDPDWINTKRAIYRFFEVMGYSQSVMKPYLTPKYWGERLLSVLSLTGNLPIDGYALTTDKWPLEFNQPSVVIANTHTWAYAGYYNYSRGLPEFQSNDFTRKLATDYQATTTWSGRLTVTGVNDKGEIVQFGPQRQALTANYYESTAPIVNPSNQQIYEEQPYVEFPSQVVVYSADNFSSSFDGSQSTFDLTRSGLAIPPDQLLAESMLVTLGASVQKPYQDYILIGNRIQFTTPPVAGLSSNVRIITSVDSSRTLTVATLAFVEAFDGARTTFTANIPSDPASLIPLEITANNTFVFLGGVEQIPLSNVNPSLPFSYSVERTSPTTVQFSFTGVPPAGTTLDVRAICSGSYWSLRSTFPVEVYSLDDISSEFNGAQTSFTLEYGGKVVNAATVTADNLLLSLGGAVQIPGVSYTIENSVLTFLDPTDAPQPDTLVNLRVITNAEFIFCPNQGKYGSSFLRWGPGIVLTLANEAGLL
jgi:hypothetical protein